MMMVVVVMMIFIMQFLSLTYKIVYKCQFQLDFIFAGSLM